MKKLHQKSPFETAHQSLRQLLRYLRYELDMPPEAIRTMISGILTSFAVEEVYERERMLTQNPERTT